MIGRFAYGLTVTTKTFSRVMALRAETQSLA